MTTTDTINPARLRTIEQAADELPWATTHSLRHMRRKADEIGVAGVFIELGGRVLVDLDALGERLSEIRAAG